LGEVDREDSRNRRVENRSPTGAQTPAEQNGLRQ
jgi:hypothetical protein